MIRPEIPFLVLEHVGVRYYRQRRFFRQEEFWALKDISLTVHHGEVLGVIGGNGAGKTTLLQVLAGILQPDRGKMERMPAHVSLLSIQVGFVNHLTGRENAILSGMLLG